MAHDIVKHISQRGSEILGLELVDIALRNGGQLDFKRASISKVSNGGWHHLLGESWVLFCENLGEAIVPANFQPPGSTCPSGYLPKTKDYLAATVPCLRAIAQLKPGTWYNYL
jgi:hypothetical protein